MPTYRHSTILAALFIAPFLACDRPTPKSDPVASSQVSAPKVRQATQPQSPSGSRLRSIYFQGDDGSRVHFYMYDSQRKEECDFVYVPGSTSSETEYRCLPESAGSVSCKDTAPYYLDDACSQRVYSVWGNADDAKYFTIEAGSEPTECGPEDPKPGLYRVGKAIEATEYYVRNSLSGDCQRIESTMGPKHLVELGDYQEMALFQRATWKIDL